MVCVCVTTLPFIYGRTAVIMLHDAINYGIAYLFLVPGVMCFLCECHYVSPCIFIFLWYFRFYFVCILSSVFYFIYFNENADSDIAL